MTNSIAGMQLVAVKTNLSPWLSGRICSPAVNRESGLERKFEVGKMYIFRSDFVRASL